ncbi:MAG: NGG1p interacting factor NIF3 [Cellvibrionaceae bacterium]
MFKVNVFIPKDNVEKVKLAMFEAGAGKIGNYDCCSWQVLGEGQFRPLKGSHPTIGNENVVEIVSEYKVEMVCQRSLIEEVVKAMKEAHVYEEPAYEIISLVDELNLT